jgi:uncharacterized protein (DUF488 family)
VKLPTASVRVQEDNKAIWNEARSADSADFFTIGYSGRDIREFVKVLKGAGVATLVDVRRNPVSMYKPDFSKKNLTRHLNKAGIEYLHFPDWGVPREIRARAAEAQDRNLIWKWYDANVVQQHLSRNLTVFLNMADQPVALMCMEYDPTSCHRHRLSLRLEQYGLTSFDL